MERSRLQRLAVTATDMVIDIYRHVSASLGAIEKDESKEAIQTIVSTSLLSVGTMMLRKQGLSLEEIQGLVRDSYETWKG